MLYPWQEAEIKAVEDWLHTDVRRRLVSAPTGSGKGTVEGRLLMRYASAAVVTPSREIIRGFAERGFDLARIFTPVELGNRLREGLASPHLIIIDEAHHDEGSNSSYTDIFALAPDARFLGYTATPYRGNPRGTQELHRLWGKPHVALTIEEAFAAGYATLPSAEIVPLFDDDLLKIDKGEFQARSASALGKTRMADLVAYHASLPPTPTCVLLPSVEMVIEFCAATGAYGVTANTRAADRSLAYAHAEQGGTLATVAVVAEGWDAPWLRRLIDCRPTMSPVRWLQAFGRICRPGVPREYKCLCRNLERHAYLMRGLLPSAVVAQGQRAFGHASGRIAKRAGLEGIGRLKRLPIPLAGGGEGSLYFVYQVEGWEQIEIAVILLPTAPEPVVAERLVGRKPDGTRDWGHWQRCELPADFSGFATSKRTGELSEKMENWWRRSAGHFGLDAGAKLTRREFAVLPILADLKMRILE